jgi:hypothetical protein
MILAFIRAEIDSPRWGPIYANVLSALRFDRSSLIDAADLKDSYANCVRAIMLGSVRGYGRNDLLFRGFPSDARWRRASLDSSDFRRLRYIGNDEFWQSLTAGSRAVVDGAHNYKDSRIAESVNAVLQKIRDGVSMPDLILIEGTQDWLIVLEGHIRVTAYVAAGIEPIFALVGSSPAMHQWAFS